MKMRLVKYSITTLICTALILLFFFNCQFYICQFYLSFIGALIEVVVLETMVEDTSNTTNKTKVRTDKPISIYAWSGADVRKWFIRHCGDYQQYIGVFTQHEITGRSLLRITENTLLRMGIIDSDDRNAIWREILKLKLKTDIVEIKDMERRNLNYDYSVEFV